MDLLIQAAIRQEETIPEEAGVKEAVGEYNGLMWPHTFATRHPAAPLLELCAIEGCPVDCGTDWTQEHIEASVRHGPH
eukprot:5723865-Ditylum_brightwellii.AAC.1